MTVGLCESCSHHAKVSNNRGGEFHLCELSLTDSAFPKYPRLPVTSCPGYTSNLNLSRQHPTGTDPGGNKRT